MTEETIVLADCPDCRGPAAIFQEGDWCVYVECMDCGAHTAFVEYNTPEERKEAEKTVAAIWNMGKVVHMAPGE